MWRAVAGAEWAKRDAMRAVDAALKASDPALIVRKALTFDGKRLKVGRLARALDVYRRVVVVGGGKASGLMAVEVERILGERLDSGVVIVPDYQRGLPRLQKVKFARSTHPLPSEKGRKAVEMMLSSLEGIGGDDLVIALISGGGSAMMPSPVEGVSVDDLNRTTRRLLKAGAEIGEINCVRKHLSRVSGGRLVERAGGAEVVALVISDVVGDDLSSVASGPTVADPTTFAEASRILRDRRVWNSVPTSVRKVIRLGTEGRARETPKPGDATFERVSNVLVASNAVACSAAKASLHASGYTVTLVGSVTGEARAVGKQLVREILTAQGSGPQALVWGGETTVTVRGKGVGGRNQELALAAAMELRGSSGAAVVSFGTDGVDGGTMAAGAYADSTTYDRARARGLDPRRSLRNNDSHAFFDAIGDLVVTGPTGTNVNDVMMALRA